MKKFVPNYYSKFKCIADKCKHSCCVGWEIDIDEKSFDFYKTVGGEIGKKLKNNISIENGTPHFVLGEKERCPFLLENGLCELFINLGEENLCEICTMHPRFVNYLSDREEIGLGLTCEEAARLILSEKEKFSLISSGKNQAEVLTDDEREILNFRELCINTVTDRRKSIKERLNILLTLSDYCAVPSLDIKYWAEKYLKLEMLDEAWGETLIKLKNTENSLDFESVLSEFGTEFEQLAVYFIYRHLIKAAEDYLSAEYLQFAFISVFMIASVLALIKKEKGEISKLDLFDTARIYSSEIEYSDENIEALLDIFSELNEEE